MPPLCWCPDLVSCGPWPTQHGGRCTAGTRSRTPFLQGLRTCPASEEGANRADGALVSSGPRRGHRRRRRDRDAVIARQLPQPPKAARSRPPPPSCWREGGRPVDTGPRRRDNSLLSLAAAKAICSTSPGNKRVPRESSGRHAGVSSSRTLFGMALMAQRGLPGHTPSQPVPAVSFAKLAGQGKAKVRVSHGQNVGSQSHRAPSQAGKAREHVPACAVCRARAQEVTGGGRVLPRRDRRGAANRGGP